MALTKIEDATITDPSVATIVIPFETCGGLPCPWTQVESPSDRWPQAAGELGGRGYGRARHFFSVGATIQPDAIILGDPRCRQEDLTCTVTTTPRLWPSWDWPAPTAKPSKPCHDGADPPRFAITVAYTRCGSSAPHTVRERPKEGGRS